MTDASVFPADTYSFAAMGTVCTLQFPGASTRGEQLAKIVRGLEAKWSRFLPDSEVSILNRHPGAFMAVSPETWDLLVGAQYWQRATGGLFDVAYDRTGEAGEVGEGASNANARIAGAELYEPGEEKVDGWSVSAGGSAGEMLGSNPEPNLDESAGDSIEDISGFYLRQGNPDAAVSRGAGLALHSGMACVGAGRQLDLGGIGKGVAADLVLQSCLEFYRAAGGDADKTGGKSVETAGVVAAGMDGATVSGTGSLGADGATVSGTGSLGADGATVSGVGSRFASEPRIMVNLGSSSLSLRAPAGEPWRIGIRSPWAGVPDPVGYLELCHGSVSLSGTARALEPGPEWRTHLMNPLTGQPAPSDVALAVVVVPAEESEQAAKVVAGSASPISVAGTAVPGSGILTSPGLAAEALSTAVLLLGAQAGLDLCVEHHVAAAVFTCDRQVLGTPDMVKFLRLNKPGLSG